MEFQKVELSPNHKITLKNTPAYQHTEKGADVMDAGNSHAFVWQSTVIEKQTLNFMRYLFTLILFALLMWALWACEEPVATKPYEPHNTSFDSGFDGWTQTPEDYHFCPWHALSDSSVHAWGAFPDSKYLLQPGAWTPGSYTASVVGENYTEKALYLRWIGVVGTEVEVLYTGSIDEVTTLNLRRRYDAVGIQVGFVDGGDDILSYNLTDIRIN